MEAVLIALLRSRARMRIMSGAASSLKMMNLAQSNVKVASWALSTTSEGRPVSSSLPALGTEKTFILKGLLW